MREIDRNLYDYIAQFAGLMEKANAGRGLAYTSYYDMLMKEGGIANSEPYTSAEEVVILGAFQSYMESPKIKSCYYNAQILALDGSLGYAEGQFFAKKLPIPLEHGWNTLPSGKVIDVTVRDTGERNTCNPKKLLERARKNQENAYFGVPLPASEIRKSWAETQMSLKLLDTRKIMEQIYERGFPAAWKKGSAMGASLKRNTWPVLAGPRPEEEWLNEPEREDFPADPTHSPFEGDIPPWAQRGYGGIFPMKGKVFYITAYVGHGPEQIVRKPTLSPVMGDAFPIQDVGRMPSGIQFGSELMFHPFAAIPVRHEDRNEAGPVIDYLNSLIQELGVFGKILLEETFPSAKEVRLPGGRWFPVDDTPLDYGGIVFLNGYTVNRIYGGPQEGGWWFDEGYPVASIPLRQEDPLAKEEWEIYLREKVGWSSPHEKSSVLGHDVFEIGLEDHFARHFPEEPPRYE